MVISPLKVKILQMKAEQVNYSNCKDWSSANVGEKYVPIPSYFSAS